jgi:hypothetical protein
LVGIPRDYLVVIQSDLLSVWLNIKVGFVFYGCFSGYADFFYSLNPAVLLNAGLQKPVLDSDTTSGMTGVDYIIAGLISA